MSGQGFKDDVAKAFRECVSLLERNKRQREALETIARLSAKAVEDDVEGYYTNEMGRIATAALAQSAPDATP